MPTNIEMFDTLPQLLSWLLNGNAIKNDLSGEVYALDPYGETFVRVEGEKLIAVPMPITGVDHWIKYSIAPRWLLSLYAANEEGCALCKVGDKKAHVKDDVLPVFALISTYRIEGAKLTYIDVVGKEWKYAIPVTADDVSRFIVVAQE